MHELSMADEVVRMVQAAALRENFTRVATLHLEAGELSGVEASALRFALDAIIPGTCLEGATIQIDEPVGRGWCVRCNAEVMITTRADPCPVCSAYPVKPTSGTALRVVDLVVVNN
jgi:hydrogenase nickel incorporation protein HypA/HybF